MKIDEEYHVVLAKYVIFTKSHKCNQKFSKIQNFFSLIFCHTLGYILCDLGVKNVYTCSLRSKRLYKKIRSLKMANFTKIRFDPLKVIFHQNGVTTRHTGGSVCGSTPTHISTPRTQFLPLNDFLLEDMLIRLVVLSLFSICC